MKFNAPKGSTDPNASYVDENLDVGQEGSIVPAIAVEAPQREIINAILAAGLIPDENNLAQLAEAIKVLGLPEGGTEGQTIVKQPDGSVTWGNVSGMPVGTLHFPEHR